MKLSIKYLLGIIIFILIPNFANIYRLILILVFGIDGYGNQFATEAIYGKSDFLLSHRLADITLIVDLGVIAIFAIYTCIIIYQETTNTNSNKKLLIIFVIGQIFYWLAVKFLIIDFLW